LKFWRTVLSGASQVLYCASPATGAWLLIAAALLAPASAVGALLGLVTATAMAWILNWNQFLLSIGLFGYNGAMVGLAWPALFPLSTPGFLLVIPAAMAATWLQGQMLPAFTRRDLPVLGAPFVLVIWTATLLSTLIGGEGFPQTIPEIVAPGAGWSNPTLRIELLSLLMQSLPGLAAAGIGLLATSPATLGVALVGLSAGLVGALGLGGLEGGLWVGAYAYTAVPLALGVAGVFFPLNVRSLALAAGVSLAGVAAWVLATWTLASLGLVSLTAVAHAALLGLILAARTEAPSKFLRIRPYALAEAAPPHRMVPSKPIQRLPEAEIAQLVSLLRRSSRVVVLSGAGMSTESGIPDYRTQLGFWYDANPQDLVHWRFLQSETSQRLYWRLQRRLSDLLDGAEPNAGHRALAELDREGRLLGIATQNVDGLHQAAGIVGSRVVELHGTVRDVICLGCGCRVSYASLRARINGNAPPCDRCGGLLKLDAVNFGEQLDPARLAQAASWCRGADLLLIVGTSLQVAPAGSLPELVRARGVPVVIINQTPTPFDPYATLVVRGAAAEVLGEARRRLMTDPPARVIRPMTRTDFQHLCLVVDSWWGDQVRYLLHPLYLEHFPQTCLVSEADGTVAGFLIGFVSQGRPDEAYVHLVATAPACRRQGTGRALYEHFFELARDRGCVKILAITVPHNETSIAFHRQMGFRLREEGAAWLGSLPFFPDYGGPGVDCVLMERKL
jgi:NAD-dependent deacetylase